MKDMIVSLLTKCDLQNAQVLTASNMSPSSSVEQIADYMATYFMKNGECVSDNQRQ